jgi:hypothetical protein
MTTCFINRKVWLAEDVFAVTLFEYTLIFHGNRPEKAERVLTENRSVAFGCGPHARLEVTKDHDAALSADWVVKLICFDSEYTRCRHWLTNKVRRSEIGAIDGGKGVESNESVILFSV